MRKQLITLTSALAALGSAHAVPVVVNVDLSTWNAEGPGNWDRAADNNSVLQTLNNDPTVFINGVDSQGVQLSGTITVETTNDNDFIGFVLGYDAGDLTNDSADYLLIDWKQGQQTFFGQPQQPGLAISRVTGAMTEPEAWGHTGDVTELARATNLGSTGWNDNQTYNFDLVFNATQVQVFVDGVLELSVNGSFENGSFGFYNFSQASVRYGALTTQDAPPPSEIPVPAAALLFGPVLAGIAWKRRR